MEDPGSKDCVCSGCLNDIGDEDYVSALGQEWHKDCFRCTVCDCGLSSWYLDRGGLLFCQTDYWAIYGDSCQQCHQVITGPLMSAGDHKYHPECFSCHDCSCHIENGHSYALINSTLYCGECYKDKKPSSRAIRVVDVPANGVTVAATESAVLRLAKIDAACGMLALHIGDRVLEVNGASVRGRSVIDIQTTLATEHVQLTVEHDPTTKQNIPKQTDTNATESKPTVKMRVKPRDNNKIDYWDDKTRTRDNNNEDNRQTESSKQEIYSQTFLEQTNDSETHEDVKTETKEIYVDSHLSLERDRRSKLDTKSPIARNMQSETKNIDIDSHLLLDKENRSKLDTKSPIERKILKEDKKNIPRHLDEAGGGEGVKRERLFKRKGEGDRPRVRRRQTPASPLMGDKERSSSMPKLLDAVDGAAPPGGVLGDLCRARSFRADSAPKQTVFRAADLIQGELLGAGFFGQVYKVTHRATGEVMVLKQLYRVDDDAQRNFLKEVAVLRSLSHPNVLRFIGVLYKDKRLHLVTEYVPGGTLHQLLQDKEVCLKWSTRARLACDVARGLGYLHRMNVIHRDLNSHNCLVREDQTVIVADFGLARIVQRTASSALERPHAARSRKRYTVVGNPYWMAPEMMNGNVYDEKVDVFSFGIILCEIIGRVSADPDFLPRRMDFGLNETVFADMFCRPYACPEPLYRIAFLACDLDPDRRPPFEVLEIWLESLSMQLSSPGPFPPNLLADIVQYANKIHHTYASPVDACCQHTHGTPRCCQHSKEPASCCEHQRSSIFCGAASCTCDRMPRPSSVVSDAGTTEGVIKSKSNTTVLPSVTACLPNALGKCVSASHIIPPARPVVTVTSLSRSQNTLAGFIVRATPQAITITKVDDITEWFDSPPPLKRASPDAHLNAIPMEKARRVDDRLDRQQTGTLPSFLRNQSVEGLESSSKADIDSPRLCRHISISDCEHDPNIVGNAPDDSDSSDDEANDMCDWYNNVSAFKKLNKMEVDGKHVLANIIVKKGDNLLNKSSYDVNSTRNKSNSHNIDTNKRRDAKHNIPQVKNIPKTNPKPIEKSNFFTKNLLSPKFSRLFKPNATEVVRNKQVDENTDEKSEKSRSKFFVQRPASPGNIRSYKIRPVDDTAEKKSHENVIKSDLKLASMGKPMTPIFRRHVPSEKNDFAHGRFSYRDRRPKYDLNLKSPEPKFVDVGRNRIKASLASIEQPKLAPLLRSSQINNIPALATVPERKIQLEKCVAKDKDIHVAVKKREPGISRSNYVSLANLRINSKGLEKAQDSVTEDSNKSLPVEKAI